MGLIASCGSVKIVRGHLGKGSPLSFWRPSAEAAVFFPTCYKKRKIGIMARDREGWTVFHHAAAASSSAALLSTICGNSTNHHAIIDERNSYELTPLHIASLRSSAVVVEKLVNYGAFRSEVDYGANAALHLACIRDPP